MKISEITIKNFKRFTDLSITNIPKEAKVIIVVGPNGSGKSSLIDALHLWHKNHIIPFQGRDNLYYPKNMLQTFDYTDNVKINFHDFKFDSAFEKTDQLKGRFYFRTAYRNQADFTISTLTKLDDPSLKNRIDNLIQNDVTVSENYQRLISLTLKSVYNSENDGMNVKDLREDLIGKIRKSLLNIFDDLTLSSIGDPLKDGTFYFEKGISKDYHYKNLSGGEKAGFDLILDLIIKSSYFDDAIYCIDEPETHMHTQLQASLFEEIYRLIPSNSQLWINTHSLGILKKARELSKLENDRIVFLNFDKLDFDKSINISPIAIDKDIWQRSIQLALDDFSDLIVPENIILCEGDVNGRKNKNFDADIYNRIFSKKHEDTLFVSIGGSNDLENDDHPSYQIIKAILKSSNIKRLIDGDDKNLEEIEELRERGINVLKRRHVESYLWDDEILIKFCNKNNRQEKVQDIITFKNEKISESNLRGNSSDERV